MIVYAAVKEPRPGAGNGRQGAFAPKRAMHSLKHSPNPLFMTYDTLKPKIS